MLRSWFAFVTLVTIDGGRMKEVRVTVGRLVNGDTSVIVSSSLGESGHRISLWLGGGRRNGEIVSLDPEEFATLVDLLANAKITADQLVEMANRPPVPGTKLTR